MRLRPRSATILSLLVWGVCLLLSVQAVLGAGLEGVIALPLPLLISAAVWAVLWSPQVILREDGVRVRNIVHSYWLPFDAITAVRIGAMLRLDALDATGYERTVTAWNAPGLPRSSAPSAAQRRRASAGGEPIASEAQRLSSDQAACPSAVVRQRWLRLAPEETGAGTASAGALSGAASDDSAGGAGAGGAGAAGAGTGVRVRYEVFAVLALAAALLLFGLLS